MKLTVWAASRPGSCLCIWSCDNSICVIFSHLTGHEYFPCLWNPLKAIYNGCVMFWMCHDLLYISLLVEVEVSGWSLHPFPPPFFVPFPPGGQCREGVTESPQVHLTCNPSPPPPPRPGQLAPQRDSEILGFQVRKGLYRPSVSILLFFG